MVKKYLFPVIAIVLLLAIFVGSGFALKNVKNSLSQVQSDLDQAAKEQAKFEKFEKYFEGATFVEQTETVEDTKGKINLSIKATKDGKQVGIIYLVNTKGFKENFNIYVFINVEDSENPKLLGFDYGEYEETYLEKLTPTYLSQFADKNLSDPKINFVINSGVTYSSTAINNAVMLARETYYTSIGKEVPAIKVSIEEISVNFEDSNMFNLKITKEEQAADVVVKYVKGKLEIVSSDVELSNDELEVLNNEFKKQIPSAYLSTVEENKITVSTNGFSGVRFLVEFEIEDNKIVKMYINPDTHGQSYEYGPDYKHSNGDPIYDFPKEMVGNPDWESMNVSAATITSTAIKNAYRLALEYVAQKGGN